MTTPGPLTEDVNKLVPRTSTALATMVTDPTPTVPAKLVVTATSAAAFGVILPRLDVRPLPLTVTLAVPIKVKSPIEILAT